MRYIAIRCGQGLLTIFCIVSLTFVLARVAGDPTALLLPPEASAEDAAAYRAALGLDQPMLVQYVQFLGDVVRLDFGESLRSGTSATEAVLSRVPATLKLAGISMVVSVLLAIALSLVSELIDRPSVRTFILTASLLREAVPAFVFGIGLIYVFGVNLRWFPFIGSTQGAASYVLPVATLSTMTLALYLRMLSSSFAEERGRDYIRTAMAKGASRFHIVLREAFPNVMLPFVTVVALNLSAVIVGSVLVETVFSWPGLAYAMVQAVQQRDFPVIQAGIIIIAVVFVIVNTASDFLAARLDPRITLS